MEIIQNQVSPTMAEADSWSLAVTQSLHAKKTPTRFVHTWKVWCCAVIKTTGRQFTFVVLEMSLWKRTIIHRFSHKHFLKRRSAAPTVWSERCCFVIRHWYRFIVSGRHNENVRRWLVFASGHKQSHRWWPEALVVTHTYPRATNRSNYWTTRALAFCSATWW